jgi:hypothetical protein
MGWPPREPGVRRLRVTSGLLAPRPRCRRASRQASVRKTGMWKHALVFVNVELDQSSDHADAVQRGRKSQ